MGCRDKARVAWLRATRRCFALLIGVSSAAAACQPQTESTREDCDGNADNGAETDVASDINHCGACDRPCRPGQGTTSCVQGRCKPRCRRGFAACDLPEKGCTTRLGTADDCGQCADRCVDAACIGGKCGPRAVLVSTGGALGPLLLSDGSALYLNSGAEYAKVPVEGGKPARMGGSRRDFPPRAFDGAYFYGYWPDPLTDYWEILRRPAGGGPVEVLCTTKVAPDPETFATDGTRLYFGRRTIPVTGGVAEILPRPCCGIDLAADSEGLYWVSGWWVALSEGGAIMKLPRGQSKPVVLARATQPRLVAVDERFVYYIADQNGIFRMPKRGGMPKLLVRLSSVNPTALAVDTRLLFWSTYDGGTYDGGPSVYRLHKPPGQ